MNLESSLKLAVQHHQAGQLAQAEAIYRQVLAVQPNQPDALHLLGLLAHQAGRQEVAIELIRRAIALNPNAAEFHMHLGASLGAAGKMDEAVAAYQRALQINPNHPQALANLGITLIHMKRLDQAVDTLRRAVKLRPDSAEVHNNLGDALHGSGETEEAIAHFRKAIELNPNFADAHNNLSGALGRKGLLDESIHHARRAIELKPELIVAHWNLASALLTKGDYVNGWPEYEWRFKMRRVGPPDPQVSGERWDGRPLNGRRIVLWDEQGIGDTINFIRFVPDVIARGGRVILACKPLMLGLLRNFDGIEQCVSFADPLPEHEFHCPIMSLPLALGTTLENLPRLQGYLKANARLWASRVPDDSRKKVGLVWAGKPAPDPTRSTTPAALAPLAGVSGIWFCSLQKGEPANEIKSSGAGFEITDWSNELVDLADTAALIANLDLVITVDTAVAHLAGALGKPTCVLLKHVPDFRWMLDRGDSPWYPTMRLFRQPRAGDWKTPIEQIAKQLAGGSL
jgi:tetratricopeptide (TPR) repeat protein